MKNRVFFIKMTHFPFLYLLWASLVTQMVKNLLAEQETQVRSLGQENPLEKEMVTHSSTLSWRIPCTEESGGLPFMESQTVGHNRANTHTHFLWGVSVQIFSPFLKWWFRFFPSLTQITSFAFLLLIINLVSLLLDHEVSEERDYFCLFLQNLFIEHCILCHYTNISYSYPLYFLKLNYSWLTMLYSSQEYLSSL